MKLSALSRNLKPVSDTYTVPLIDEHDPRVCHILTSLDDVSMDSAITCFILGVPQDIGVERNGGRKGAQMAPQTIRKALYKFATSTLLSAVESKRLSIVDAGDINTEGKTLEQIHDQQHDVVYNIIKNGGIPIIIGGGHDTAWPTIQALNRHQQPYGVINIDAHLDVRPLLEDSRSHSGSPFRQMLEESNSCLVDNGFVEYGIQPHAVSTSHINYVQHHGMRIVSLQEARRHDVSRSLVDSWNAITKNSDGYVSLDMDGFASAFAPGVSAPAADGFTPWEVLPALTTIASSGKLMAFDVVEVNPEYDVDGRTSKLAASAIMHVLEGIAQAG